MATSEGISSARGSALPRRWSRARQSISLAIVAAVAVLILIMVRAFSRTPADVPPAPTASGELIVTPDQYAALKIATVGGDAIGVSSRASGVIAVDDYHSTAVLPPFSGRVMQVFVQPGEQVKEGQPLLRIRAPEFVDSRNALLAAAAQRTAAAAALKIVESSATRAEAVYKTAGGALKDFQSAQNDLSAARAAVRTADAAVGAARGRLLVIGKSPAEVMQLEGAKVVDSSDAETLVRAPIAGTVASRSISVGQNLSAASAAAAFVITNASTVWLIAQVPESASAQVHLGDAVVVTTPAFPGRTFAARVDNIGAGLDPATHRLPVRATIRNPDGALRPQMFASFIIRGRAVPGDNGVSVPASAVIHEGDAARVWVAGPGRTLRARNVTLGPASDGMVAVTRGLSPGERVVTAGTIFVNEAGLPG